MKCGCGYEWDTNSKLERVTCPSCGNKVRVRPANGKTEEGEEKHA